MTPKTADQCPVTCPYLLLAPECHYVGCELGRAMIGIVRENLIIEPEVKEIE
jgi:hypothetical protein